MTGGSSEDFAAMTSDEMDLLKVQLREVGARLSSPPSDVEELRSLIDQTRNLLLKVDQSPPKAISDVLKSTMTALVARDLLDNSDVDVKVGVTSCLTEITRITAPDAPYDDDQMKEIFERIVEVFEHFDDVSSRFFSKSVAILQTVAKVRSCAVMLDLECDCLILKMFQHFLKTIRPENTEHVFSSMEAIMTLALEESEDISSELISCLLESVKVDTDNLPVAHCLAEKVISNTADKLKPYLRELFQSINLRDYSSVIASLCQDTAEVSLAISGDIMADDTPTVSDAEEVMNEKLPELCLNNGNPAVEPSSSMQKHVDEDPDNISGPVPNEEFKKTYDSERKPLLHNYKKEQNSVAISAETPAHATNLSEEKSQKQSNRKASGLMSSGSKAHKTKGKREVGVNVQSINKRAHGAEATPPHKRKRLGETLVGSRIKVWWPEDQEYYPGTVESYDPYSKKHKVVYDDGDVEILLMKKENWDLLCDDVENVRHDSLEEPQSKRKKTSSISISEENARGTGSDPPKRKGRPPKSLALAGDSSRGKAIQKSGTKSIAAVNSKTDGRIYKDDSEGKGRKEVLKGKSNEDKPENWGFV